MQKKSKFKNKIKPVSQAHQGARGKTFESKIITKVTFKFCTKEYTQKCFLSKKLVET